MTDPLPSPIDWATIQSALHAWVSQSADISATWAMQERPQLEYPYAVLQIIAGPNNFGEDEIVYREDGASLFADVQGLRTMTVNVQFFTRSFLPGEHAQAYAAIAQSAIEHPRFSQALYDAGIGVSSISAITDLSQIVGSAYESRASFDLIVIIAAKVADSVSQDWFNIVNLDGKNIGPP